jgi:hypothetical protein
MPESGTYGSGRGVVGNHRSYRYREHSPEIDRGGSSRLYPSTRKAKSQDAIWQVSCDGSGVRTAGMQAKGSM